MSKQQPALKFKRKLCFELTVETDLQEIVEQYGRIRLTYRADSNPKNVEIARHFARINMINPGRYRQARSLAEYKGDFYEESVKNKVFPKILGLGYDSYVELKRIFKREYNKEIRMPDRAVSRIYLKLAH